MRLEKSNGSGAWRCAGLRQTDSRDKNVGSFNVNAGEDASNKGKRNLTVSGNMLDVLQLRANVTIVAAKILSVVVVVVMGGERCLCKH